MVRNVFEVHSFIQGVWKLRDGGGLLKPVGPVWLFALAYGLQGVVFGVWSVRLLPGLSVWGSGLKRV